MRIEVSVTDTRQAYVDAKGRFARNPTVLAHPNYRMRDDAALSVLHFGAVVPPLSPWVGVRRLQPGSSYDKAFNRNPKPLDSSVGSSPLTLEQQTKQVVKNLDASLLRVLESTTSPIVLFSGGVDSGLIASRLAHLGCFDATLVNFRFGSNDQESQVAEAMAAALGLRFERVESTGPSLDVLERPGAHFAEPFGDLSVVPSLELAQAVCASFTGTPQTIIDGTGADGAFGLSGKIRALSKVRRIPRGLRWLASRPYARYFWHRTGRAEAALRIVRRSVDHSLPGTLISQNALSGAFYDASRRSMLDQSLRDWLGELVGDCEEECAILADIALTCANVFAQKTRPIFEAAGHSVAYPFLEQTMVKAALRWHPSAHSFSPKAPLKAALAQAVGSSMVYRAKSGFTDPNADVLYHPEFVSMLAKTVEGDAPLARLLNHNMIAAAGRRLEQRIRLPVQTQNLLWAVCFTDRWYRTAVDRAPPEADMASPPFAGSSRARRADAIK